MLPELLPTKVVRNVKYRCEAVNQVRFATRGPERTDKLRQKFAKSNNFTEAPVTTEFIVREDGLLTEKRAHEAAQRLQGTDLDPVTHEAHLMLVRAYTALTAAARRNNPSSQSLGRYNVLRLLHDAEGHRLLMSEIGDGLETSPTVVTRLVDALVADGLVRRIDHPDDKRKTWAEITDAGAALFESEAPLMMIEVQKLWQGVTDEEKRLLVHLLTKVRLSVKSASLRYPEIRQR